VIVATVWAHVVAEHEEMASHFDAVLATLRLPDYRTPDPRPGRERYYKEGVGPQNWLRVVLKFDGAVDRLVTTFGQPDDPRLEP
jgi:hypothetical protein